MLHLCFHTVYFSFVIQLQTLQFFIFPNDGWSEKQSALFEDMRLLFNSCVVFQRWKKEQKAPEPLDQMKPSANQSKPIICGLPPPVLSLSLCDSPVCLKNNALFNWILFRGNSNADLVIRETLKIYVCLILWICVCCVIQQCTGAKPNHLKRKKKCPL